MGRRGRMVVCGLVIAVAGYAGGAVWRVQAAGWQAQDRAGGSGVAAKGFSVAVTYSERARKRLEDGREAVIVDASLSGQPRAGAPARYANEVGGVALGGKKIEMQPGDRARFGEIPMRAEALRQVDAGGPQLLINVYSGRKSSPDNLLACGIFEGPLASAVGRELPIACKLIGE